MIEILRKEGWKLNPNDGVVNAILRRCEKCDGLCPCTHDSEDYEGKDLLENSQESSLPLRASSIH